MCVGHHLAQTNTNNVNKTRVLLQTTGVKEEANIVFMRTSQHGILNVKTMIGLNFGHHYTQTYAKPQE